MNNDLVTPIIAKLKERNAQTPPDVSKFPQRYALQFNITDKDKVGVFYLEILDGKISIEPYDYNDRDAAITVSKQNLLKIIDGKLNVVAAFGLGQIKVEGDLGKAAMLTQVI